MALERQLFRKGCEQKSPLVDVMTGCLVGGVAPGVHVLLRLMEGKVCSNAHKYDDHIRCFKSRLMNSLVFVERRTFTEPNTRHMVKVKAMAVCAGSSDGS